MSSPNYADWFDALDKRVDIILKISCDAHTISDTETWAWDAEADTAIRSVFPSWHRVRVNWEASEHHPRYHFSTRDFQRLAGAFKAGASLVRGGQLGSLADAIRAKTEDDLLDQADALLDRHVVAAAVIAGGALETHLRHLVEKNSLAISGNGSIEAYNQAIAQLRNAGTEVYSAILGKQITAWGGIRNNAAHDPANFKATKEDVRRMIDGVRDFIDRTTPL
jgi:hypothetical protein